MVGAKKRQAVILRFLAADSFKCGTANRADFHLAAHNVRLNGPFSHIEPHAFYVFAQGCLRPEQTPIVGSPLKICMITIFRLI